MRGSGGKGKSGKKYDSPSNNRRSTPKGVYIMDKTLIPRLKQYLSQFRKGYVPDVEEMTSYLQSRYGDYSRKKRHVFKSSVQKAYQAISIEDKESRYLQKLENKFLQIKNNSDSMYDAQEDKIQTDDDTSDSEVSLTEEPLIELQGNNLMNQSMQSMYKLSRPTSDAEDDPCNDSRVDQNSNKDQGSSESMKQPIPIIASTPMETAVNKQMTETVLMDEQCTPAMDNQKSSESQNKRKTNEEKADMADTPRQSKKRRKRQESKKDEDDNLPQFVSTASTVKFADIGGCDDAIEQVCKMLIHMRHPEVFSTLGITPPRGFLLHGPPGCGKTLLAHAIAGELELPFLKLAATEIVSGVSGESEEKVRDLFNSAVAQAPCVMFIDEIDAITPKRETASKDMERRIVSQLLTCMDDLNNNPSVQVLVVGATNRPDSLDPALRRAGRFDREICMGIPDQKARERVLQVLCKQLKLNEDFSYSALACLTPGFVGADLMALTREAAMVAVNRVFQGLKETAKPDREESTSSYVNRTEDKKIQQTEKNPEHSHVMEWLKNQPPLTEEQLGVLSIAMDDFKAALLTVQPSAKREGFATIPDVTWKDVGALKDVREELTMAILAPVQHPEEFAALGLSHPPGILLAGPPGCGKTLLAKAIANESGINFISVKGPELLNMYVGESERAVRQVFQRARNSSPCVIFFDELDALCPRRSGSSESGVSVRVVNQLLTEMDGLEARKQVFIMAATNRPDIIDPAVVRPGRLDKILYVGLPSPDDRKDILTTITKNGSKPLLLPDVDLDKIAISERSTGYSGADLSALVREASMAALRERIDTSSIRVDGATTDKLPTVGVGERHFEIAFSRVKPSVSKKDQSMYEEIKTFASKI